LICHLSAPCCIIYLFSTSVRFYLD